MKNRIGSGVDGILRESAALVGLIELAIDNPPSEEAAKWLFESAKDMADYIHAEAKGMELLRSARND